VVIGGTTGSGKTILLRWLLYRLAVQNRPEDLRLLLVDPKRFELTGFAHLPHLLHPPVSNHLDIARVLTWLTGELDRRADRGSTRPRIVCAVEEVADVLAVNREVGPLLARVAQIGRGLGVHLIVTTQQPGAKSLGDSLANFPARILGRVASATLSYGAAGREKSGAHVLLGRGDFLLLAAGETTRFQAPLPDGHQWARLPRTDQVARLDDELPTLVEFADRNHDPRGGRGRRELSPSDYDAAQEALDDGADADDLRGRFGIGYERARRMRTQYTEATR
jgi:S-DNA-T family DNA segregation ATPase FtsK/SpoIIIE